ncbi:MAG: hypothetical protein LBH32_01355 [Dysgonamonadaceae bacterium]|jgi:acyl-CoA synthetase (AMP-forming)/AMP-acid ligase II|nr:hypothetical protein [Dysgonamonadaceae bacterium]
MTDTLMNILQWLIPGGGLGVVITWIVSQRVRKTKEQKEVTDVYKEMYESKSQTVRELNEEINNLYRELGNTRRAVAKIYACPHYDDCPVRDELPFDKTGKLKRCRKVNRHKAGNNNEGCEDAAGTGSESEHCNPCTESA